MKMIKYSARAAGAHPFPPRRKRMQKDVEERHCGGGIQICHATARSANASRTQPLTRLQTCGTLRAKKSPHVHADSGIRCRPPLHAQEEAFRRSYPTSNFQCLISSLAAEICHLNSNLAPAGAIQRGPFSAYCSLFKRKLLVISANSTCRSGL